jgi:cytochrome c553
MRRFVGRQTIAAVGSLAALTLVVGSAPARADGDIRAGAAKVAMCVGCHGIPEYRAAYPEVYRVPLLAGQNQQYIESALKAYRAKQRHFGSMNAIAASLSDQDIADLAAYYASRTPDSPDNPYK